MARGEWAVITGATSGIGRALCDEFAADNTNLVLVARDEAALSQVAKTIQGHYGTEVRVISADLSETGGAQKLIMQIEHLGIEVDYLVNNAGFGGYGSFVKTDWRDEQAMIQLNITSLTQLCKTYGSKMVGRGKGKILNLASTAAFFAGPKMAVYFATKTYVLHLSEALHEEFRGSGVTVTAFCPGPTASKFAEVAHASEISIFRGKLATSEEVAHFGYRAMQDGKPVAIHRWQNRVIIGVSRILPRQILTRFVGRAQG